MLTKQTGTVNECLGIAGHEQYVLAALQHTATHCNKLQHTSTHCKTLQHARAVFCVSRVDYLWAGNVNEFFGIGGHVEYVRLFRYLVLKTKICHICIKHTFSNI